MCGIIAIAASRGLPKSQVIERMRDAVAHRGPDDATLERIDNWIALGHRRLSIIDVEGAQQPLRTESGDVVVVFNGEIYNFQELRRRLVALGHTFATHGDGEVIAHGYEQWGDDIFRQLHGMFAVVLVDRARQRFVAARDRFGIKPLFYAPRPDGLAVASELKSLLILEPRAASRQALELGALRMHIPWPYTAYDGLFRLPPGTFVEVTQRQSPRITRFASMFDGQTTTSSPHEAHERVSNAIARQMVADVPVGAFLSGGVDSSLIVAMMREHTSAPIHTFSIRSAWDDESAVAARTSSTLGTVHHVATLDDMTIEHLAELPRMYDEPFAETSALGVRALSLAAREHVKVALSGDGGDEVFGGYGSYRWIRALARSHGPFPRLGHGAHALLQRRRWPESIRRALRAALLLGDSPETAQRDTTTLAWAASQSHRNASEELSTHIQEAIGIARTPQEFARRAMLADRLERLPNAMLAKVDAASMSASLEVRVPFLDDDLVEYADQLPIDELVGWKWNKHILRRVLAETPAGDVAWAPKRGFSLPLEPWMRKNGPKLGELFGDCAATIRELTGHDVLATWTAFQEGRTRMSAGTTAMQLLWYATVGFWSAERSIRVARSSPLPVNAIT